MAKFIAISGGNAPCLEGDHDSLAEIVDQYDDEEQEDFLFLRVNDDFSVEEVSLPEKISEAIMNSEESDEWITIELNGLEVKVPRGTTEEQLKAAVNGEVCGVTGDLDQTQW